MKNFTFSFILLLTTFSTFARGGSMVNKSADTIKLQTDSNHNVYYQNTVKLGTEIPAPLIFERSLQLMAAKNFAQNYLNDNEWKLIFTTTQDLNINKVYVGDDNDDLEPYTVQFAITLDIKNGRYRYTINNVVFFLPDSSFNKRETLYEIYTKATNTNSKRVAKNAKELIASFERYLDGLTGDLKQSIERKAMMYNSKF